MSSQFMVVEYMGDHVYDVRSTGNGRWIDQKCTYDVLNFSADLVVEYLGETREERFTSPELWKSEYANEQVHAVFAKPDTKDKKALDEFNKFFRQPLKMMSAAGVLREVHSGSPIVFAVEDYEALRYIASREHRSLEFLTAYIEKTLRDSGLWPEFEKFFSLQTKSALQDLKQVFYQFCVKYTPINTETESNRIFAKVLNPLAFQRHLHGVKRGQMSRHFITKDELVYNRLNWRDILSGKEKDIARRGFVPDTTTDYKLQHEINEAINVVKLFNNRWRGGKSEVVDINALASKANVAHHIFPKSQFRELAAYKENLAVLTSAQHIGSAHPDGNTLVVDSDYQRTCLLAKINVIEENVDGKLGDAVIYSYDRLTEMLDIGFDADGMFSRLPHGSFGAIRTHIDLFYST